MKFAPELLMKFNAYLDSTYKPVILFGLTYRPSEVLRAAEPTKYATLYQRYIIDIIEKKEGSHD